MVIGSISKESPMPLLIAAKPVQQVSEYKFLGVTVNSRLKWDDHIAAITSKAAKRLWFLKKLKRAGVSREDLVYFYHAGCCPTWTSPGVCMPGLAHEPRVPSRACIQQDCRGSGRSITNDQTKSLKDIVEKLLRVCERELTWLDMAINFKKSCCIRIGPRPLRQNNWHSL